LPDKAVFFPLLLAWSLLFHFLGNSTFGYVETGSLFSWMINAYTAETVVSDDGHGLILPFVVLGLFWWKREQLLAQPMKTWWPAVLIVLAAVVAHVLGYVVQQTRLSILAYFLGVFGLMGLVWGWRFLRASLFPFVLFAFMMPLGSLTERVTFPLRIMVTELSVFIGRHILGADVVAIGTQLFNPSMGFKYEVAVACSGMRSLVAIGLISIVYAAVVLRRNSSRMALIAVAIPLAVIGNTARLLLIIFAAQLGGQSWGDYVHEDALFSMTPYVPAILGLIWAGGRLERFEKMHGAEGVR
jgi:exosortase